MPMMPSKIHGSKNWWHVLYHESGKGEKSHIHVEHKKFKLVFAASSFDIIHDCKKITKEERKEIKKILIEFVNMYNIQESCYYNKSKRKYMFNPIDNKPIPIEEDTHIEKRIDPNIDEYKYFAKSAALGDSNKTHENNWIEEKKIRKFIEIDNRSLRTKLIALYKQAREILLNSKYKDDYTKRK